MDCVVIGAGPAGLTAAWELTRLGRRSIVFEQDDVVGGISRTCTYKGYRFDIGGHRFFTKVELVQRLWEEILADEFLVRPRLSRIYYGGKFFDYPLKPVNALLGLGPVEAVRIGTSWVWAQLFPSREERTFEQWVSNRFGRRLFEIFFKGYTEKVWGMPCSEISADFASQRIKNLDLAAALKNMLLGAGSSGGQVITTLIERFHYPRHGPGQMWECAQRRLAEKGVETLLRASVTRLRHEGGRVRSARVRFADGTEREVEAEHFLSSMPIRTLLHSLDPAPPPAVLEAAASLRYRDFLTVGLIVDREELFPDNWIYVHSDAVQLGRIQNFKNWSPEMVPDPSKTSLGLEYFVQEGDALWSASDADLVELGRREIDRLGLAGAEEVVDGTVIRMPKAYPVYDGSYQEALVTIREWLAGLPNLQLIGRNGQHHYNNQDHSMVTAVYAARNIAAGDVAWDVWGVNVEGDYHEEVRREEVRGSERLVPQRAEGPSVEDLVRDAFARYDPVALGGAVGVVMGLGLFLATVLLLLRGGVDVGANLAVLENYLLGYSVSWSGAVVGLLEAGLGGFGFGWVLARLINLVIAAEERGLLLRVEERALDYFEGGGR